MRNLRRLAPLPVIVLCLSYVQGVRAEPATRPAVEKPTFLRLVDNGRAGGRLEAAVVTYKNDKGQRVDLVSAVHIGERSYFEALANSFDNYDAVLYELVKPKDGGLPVAGQESGSAIGKMQRFLKDSLNLEFQLDCIDYTKKNFVHADLDAETFERLQKERGETFPQLLLKAFQKAMSDPGAMGAQAQDPGQMLRDLVGMLTRPDMERQLKLLLARQMQDLEAQTAGFAGADGKSVIVHERNTKALQVLKDTLAGGKKNVAIFYGAAHMPDIHDHLVADLGFRPVHTEYKLAWDLTIRVDQPSAIEQLLEGALKALDE